MKKYLRACAAAALLALTMSGCAELGITPPFDATGVYRGTWEGTVQGEASGDRSCAVTFDLKQADSYQLFQGFALTGEATVYFSCASMLDDIAETGLPARVSLTVQGFLLPDGSIAFASIEPGAAQSVLITVSGTGLDNDKSGTMDQIKANWTLLIDQPSHPRITIKGTVDAGTN
jgi:hypothetical protein